MAAKVSARFIINNIIEPKKEWFEYENDGTLEWLNDKANKPVGFTYHVENELVDWQSDQRSGVESVVQVGLVERLAVGYKLYLRLNLTGIANGQEDEEVWNHFDEVDLGKDRDAGTRWAYGTITAVTIDQVPEKVFAKFGEHLKSGVFDSSTGVYVLSPAERDTIENLLSEVKKRRIRVRENGLSWDITGQKGFTFPQFRKAGEKGLFGCVVSQPRASKNAPGQIWFSMVGLTMIGYELGDFRTGGDVAIDVGLIAIEEHFELLQQVGGTRTVPTKLVEPEPETKPEPEPESDNRKGLARRGKSKLGL